MWDCGAGNLPTALGELVSLTNLDISNNKLAGSIPSELIGATALRQMYLYENSLTGTTPTAVQFYVVSYLCFNEFYCIATV